MTYTKFPTDLWQKPSGTQYFSSGIHQYVRYTHEKLLKRKIVRVCKCKHTKNVRCACEKHPMFATV